MKRRANGEGSLVHRKDGRWYARIMVGDKLRHHYAHTQSECLDWLAGQRIKAGKGLPAQGGRVPVAVYLAHWLAWMHWTLRPASRCHYEVAVRRHLVPHIGDLALDELRPLHIDGCYAQLREQGVGAPSVAFAHDVLHRALTQAVVWELIERNPADLATRPTAPRRKRRALQPGEARRLLAAARGDPLEPLWQLALITGMRLGELLGLRWVDVDMERGELAVVCQAQVGELVDPKTEDSVRRIVLGPASVAMLTRHRVTQNGAGTGLVFPGEGGGPLRVGQVRGAFKRLLKRAGLPDMRFHELRHTSSSLLAGEDVHPSVVQERLGHADVSMTLGVYTHVAPALHRAAAEAIEGALGLEE